MVKKKKGFYLKKKKVLIKKGKNSNYTFIPSHGPSPFNYLSIALHVEQSLRKKKGTQFLIGGSVLLSLMYTGSAQM